MVLRLCMARECEGCYSCEGYLSDSGDLICIHCTAPFEFCDSYESLLVHCTSRSTPTIAREKFWVQSVISMSHKSCGAGGCASDVAVVKAPFLAKHGVFRRLNPGAESRPTPPNQKQSEHNC